MDRAPLPDLHPDAVALTAFRAMPDGSGRAYTVCETPVRNVINFWLRRTWAIGYTKPSHTSQCDCYAVLDVLNAADDVVQDFCIPTAAAFRWWYRTLDLRVSPEPVDAR